MTPEQILGAIDVADTHRAQLIEKGCTPDQADARAYAFLKSWLFAQLEAVQ